MAPDHGYRMAGMAVLVAVFTLVIAGAAAAAPPSADFSPTPAVARVGAPVSFSGTAAGNAGATIASVSWDFGDGSGSTSGLSVSHAYASPGTKTIILRVTDSNNEVTTATHTVSVVGLPHASFSFSPAVPNIGDGVAFDGSSSGDPGGSITYAWDFGDGGTGTGAKSTHAYASSGDKTVSLTVTAALDGLSASTTHTVHVNVPPVAAFAFAAVVQPPTGQDRFTPLIGQQVAFSALSAGDADGPNGKPVSYAWDLGTGAFGTPVAANNLITRFPVAGPRTIRLRVTDDHGATGVAQVTLRVNTPPVAAFTFTPAAPVPNATVAFTSGARDADGDLTALQWDLNGDGSFDDASGPTAKAAYLTPGDYSVGLQATDSGRATATTFRTVTVQGPPAPPPVLSGGPPGSDPVIVPSPGAAPLTATSTPPGAGSVLGTAASGTSPAVRLKAVPNVRVQIAGSVTGGLTRITRLVVVAPKGALVVARCRGNGCPKKALRRRVTSSGRVRLATLERRLRAGARIVVSVAKDGYATRRIVLTLRRGSAPLRTQSCVYPGRPKPGPCSA